MITISPSILAANFLKLEQEIIPFKECSDLWFHIDIMDGHYVPNLTFGKVVLENIKNITSHKLDAHFMVSNPEDYIDTYKDIGLHNFSFHWEAVTHHDSLISRIKDVYPSVGIALNPGTSADVIPDYLLEKIDLILIMSVNPGFGGQSFIKSSIDKIKYFQDKKIQNNYNYSIQVDGGVTDKNSNKLIKAGATNLVAGSYIYKSNDYLSAVESLRN